MAGLASSPSTSCGAASVDRFTAASFRGRNARRKAQTASHVAMVRFTSNFVAACEATRCLGAHRSSWSRCKAVERRDGAAGARAGQTDGVAVEEEDEYLDDMLPSPKVAVNVTNLGNNTRKVEAKIAIHAPLEAVWGVLTDYDRLADHIPGLAESQVLERRPHGARLLQIGQKNLALGVKFKAKAVVEVTEEPPQALHDGTLRDLHFVTVEGDFQVFKGTWRMHQVGGHSKPGAAKTRVETYLSYILEVQPKTWIPVALIEGVVCHEITCNLISVRNVAVRHKSLSL